MRQRILIVAKDVTFRGRLARALKSGGYGVELAESAAHARRIGLKGFALSLVAPDGLGPETSKLLGELETSNAKPLLIAVDGTAEAGGDSFRFSDEADLLSRVAEALQPVSEQDAPEPVLQFDRYRLDVAGYALTDAAGQAIPLTRGEFSVLREFVRRPGRVLSRDQLLNSLAGRDAESYDRSIDMLMVRLRRKIEADPKRPSLIVTVPGLGYKFTAKVAEAAMAEPASAASKPESITPVPSPPAAPERRQLTILHAVLSGPAFAAARRDPEDLQRVLAAFHEHCAAVIAQAGGTIDRLLNDGALVYFGYPQADEHQAERAVRASLRLIETTGRIDAGQTGRLQIRVGVATGLAVVGGPPGASGQPSALGEAASIAAGLAAQARPDDVLISASTRRLVGGLFECREHQPIALDDLAAPVEAWQVTGEGAAEGRFEALHGAALAPLVGREEELALLLRRWEQAKAGSGKVVLISGEPGIGKSRLTRGLQNAIAGQPHIELRFFCSPHHQDSALHPILAQIEHAAGFARDDNDEAKLAKLDALLAQSDATDEAVTLIAELLSIATDQRERIQQMTPRARREKTLSALLAQFAGLARRQPVLAMYEDLHWIDPSSRELLHRSIEQLERLPVLLLATFRPEFQPPWTGQPNVANLALNRLDRNDTAAMIAGIAGEDGLPTEIMQEIAERTDGVPLFIEEVTKAVVESGEQATETLAVMPPVGLSVPATLHASLLARLDRLGPAAKEVAQTGAAIGREFGHALLASLAELSEPKLREALDRLMNSGLLFVRGTPPDAIYTFKHALVRDTAYATLLRGRRQRLHQRIAETIRDRLHERADAEPEVVAYHFAQAGLLPAAIEWFGKAGQRAKSRVANFESVQSFTHALTLIGRMAPGKDRDRLELSFRLALGLPLLAVRGYASVEVESNYEMASELANKLADREAQFTSTRGLWNCIYDRGELDRSIALARRLLDLAGQESNTEKLALALRALGSSQMTRGEFVLCEESFDNCINVCVNLPFGHCIEVHGEAPQIVASQYRGMSLCIRGYADRGLESVRRAVAQARQANHPISLAFALHILCIVHLLRREYGISEEVANEMSDIATEHDFVFWIAGSEVVQGGVLANLGRADEGVALAERGLTNWMKTNARLHIPTWSSFLIDAALISGRLTRAEEALATALPIAKRNGGDAFALAELERLQGRLLLLQDRPDEARLAFEAAIDTAERQGAKLYSLRAARDLARLLVQSGDRRAAVQRLAPIVRDYPEHREGKDFTEARELLVEPN